MKTQIQIGQKEYGTTMASSISTFATLEKNEYGTFASNCQQIHARETGGRAGTDLYGPTSLTTTTTTTKTTTTTTLVTLMGCQ